MTSFGCGLTRFRENTHAVQENNCREIVEVPEGPEWKIRRLYEKYECFSWKYPESSVIVNYHINRLKNNENPIDANLKYFYAKVSHFMSPVEISLQPTFLKSARKGIMQQMNAYYTFVESNSPSSCEFRNENIFAPIACAVNECGIWYRGKIVQVSGNEHVVVELVDIGTQILVRTSSIRPLIRKFGRAPALCLKCKVDGISINDLETNDLLEFKSIVEMCNSLFRVEIKSTIEPFLIDLYHPTIANKNVCEKFLPPPEDKGKLERLDRNWIAHCRKMTNVFDEDADDDWNHRWATKYSGDHQKMDCCKIKYIRRLGKCAKAPRFEDDELVVVHVENAELIYVQYKWQMETRNRIEKELMREWETLAEIPQKLMIPDQLCAVNLGNNYFHRCIITEDRPSVLSLLLVDYGIHVDFENDPSSYRLIPDTEIYKQQPMIIIISLGSSYYGIPHHSETQILRRIIKPGDTVRFQWDKKSKQIPTKGNLIAGNRLNVQEELKESLKLSRQDTKCRDLVKFHNYSRNFDAPLISHIYRITCHQHYSKGTIETGEL